MDLKVSGLHHVTAIAGDPQRNVDFYTNVLGLRLVKVTVKFDDPGAYHLYFGDGQGRPGTLLTFFIWTDKPRGRRGIGQATAVSFSVPAEALIYWSDRLQSYNIPLNGVKTRFGEPVLSFTDPDGLALELVAPPMPDERAGWPEGPVPGDYAICGFHGITLSVHSYEKTAAFLTDAMNFRLLTKEGSCLRYETDCGGPGSLVDIVGQPDDLEGQMGTGVVHHIAWRTPGDSEQLAWRQKLVRLGYSVSPVMDRQYFHSIYFYEPGGVKCEIATDPPGFTVDEAPEALGTHLMLPAQHESRMHRADGRTVAIAGKHLEEMRMPPTASAPRLRRGE